MLFDGWRRWRRKPAAFEVVMYTRQGCHLCEDAWAELERWRARLGFKLRAVDIDGDPELRAKYDQLVPVVTVDGKERFRGIVNPALLRRLLEAEARKQR